MNSLIPYTIESDCRIEIEPGTAGLYHDLYRANRGTDYRISNLGRKLETASKPDKARAVVHLSKDEAQWFYNQVFAKIIALSHDYNEGKHGGEAVQLNELARQFGVNARIERISDNVYGWDQDPVQANG